MGSWLNSGHGTTYVYDTMGRMTAVSAVKYTDGDPEVFTDLEQDVSYVYNDGYLTSIGEFI